MTYYITFSPFYNQLKNQEKIQTGQDKNPAGDGFFASGYVRIRIQLGWDGHWFPKNYFSFQKL